MESTVLMVIFTLELFLKTACMYKIKFISHSEVFLMIKGTCQLCIDS